MKSLVFILFVNLLSVPCHSRAEKLRLAVASNFSLTLKKLVSEFEKQSNHQVTISAASTGKLYAQILHGAPYDVFLSADSQRAELLVKKKLAKDSSVYARGKLVFVAKNKNSQSCQGVLDEPLQNRLAIANPKTAPYGVAAKDVLMKLGKWNSVKNQLVMGENIVQAYQFLTTANAGAGFIAGSLAVNSKELAGFCQWQVPSKLHKPIRQKLVILNRASQNIAAREFISYMKSGRAKKIMRDNGYIL